MAATERKIFAMHLMLAFRYRHIYYVIYTWKITSFKNFLILESAVKCPRPLLETYLEIKWVMWSIKHLWIAPLQPSLVEKLTEIRNEWEQRHQEGGQFYEYFSTYKSDYIKISMTAEIREMAGLGYPPGMYNQNANEYANSVIKRDLDVRKISIKEVTLHLQQLIQRQYEEVKLAMIGRGEWEVRNE